jgi:hypothetical protein
MKNLIKSILKANKALFAGVFSLSLVLTSAFGLVDTAFAATPSLSVVNNSANMVQITVNGGDANSTINLYYNLSSSSNVYGANLGTTNSSGYFSTNLNQNSYSIPQNAYVYVIVNGQTSNTVLWPNNVNNYNQPTYLSQSSININVGQGQSISISGSGSYTISSNSNPTAISSLVNGSILNVYGSAPGSGTLNVCSTSGNGGCASLYVTVSGYTYNNNNTGYTTYNNGSYYNGYPYGYTYNNQGRVLGASTDSSSVYLSQVPSTGVSLNLKVILFVIGLLSWSLFAAYIFMAKQKKFVSR